MKRRLSSLLLIALAIFTLSSCKGKDKLLFLNWGEYIPEELLLEFEQRYNCDVLMDLGDTNEIFYSYVASETTVYDVVCPSDYMVEKMYSNDLLQKLDFSKLPSLDKSNYLAGVTSIANEMEEAYPGVSDYYVPYLWGTWCIMYNSDNEGIAKGVTESSNEWASLFDRSALPSGTRVAMYDSNQHVYYAALRYLGYETKYDLKDAYSDLSDVEKLIKSMDYNAWGTDNIKKDIVAGNLDVGYMWTGDFLYYYCEQTAKVVVDAYNNGDVTIEKTPEMIEQLINPEIGYYVGTKTAKKYTIGIEAYIPSNTVAFCDNLVMTKDAQHKDLAYKFIDFMISNSNKIDNDPETEIDPNYDLTYFVCYNTPYLSTYESLIALKDLELGTEDEDGYKEEVAGGTDKYDTTLYWNFYDVAIGYSFIKYYSSTEVKGHKLPCLDRKYINKVISTINNARV